MTPHQQHRDMCDEMWISKNKKQEENSVLVCCDLLLLLAGWWRKTLCSHRCKPSWAQPNIIRLSKRIAKCCECVIINVYMQPRKDNQLFSCALINILLHRSFFSSFLFLAGSSLSLSSRHIRSSKDLSYATAAAANATPLIWCCPTSWYVGTTQSEE